MASADQSTRIVSMQSSVESGPARHVTSHYCELVFYYIQISSPNRHRSMKKQGFTLLAAVALALVGCSGEKTSAAGAKGAGGRGGGRGGDAAVPVTVAKAVQKDIPVQAEVIGTVEPYATVSVKPQISGQLMQAHFNEGDFVKQGQLLLTIDARAIEAQLKQTEATILRDQAQMQQAQANLARDRSQESNAKSQLQRADQLAAGGIISKEQHDQAATALESLNATINADIAAIENAKAQIAASRAMLENQKVQMGFTKVFSPIAGRTGSLLVKPGNIIQANTTDVATINQVQPAYVSFALPESYLAELRRAGSGLQVVVKTEQGEGTAVGKVSYFENTVDVTTGTIRVKAKFDNQDRLLWPGQFVRVTLKLQDRPNAIVVPSQAVQTGQEGLFVYIVKPDQTVDIRPVRAGQRAGDETVIEDGVQPGETVVTEGTLRLVAGSRVQLRERGQGGSGRPGGGAGRQGSRGGQPAREGQGESGQK
jgi:membrane fusion protein, multidrug efflux system